MSAAWTGAGVTLFALAVTPGFARELTQLGDLATPLVPWLQDYSAAVPYGLAEVQAQVDGAAAAGSCDWIVRDLEFTYTQGVTAAC